MIRAARPAAAQESDARGRGSPLLPPGPRSRAALGLTAAAALGRFELQGAPTAAPFNIRRARRAIAALPARCGGASRRARRADCRTTDVHHSHDPFFRERVPWRLGMVRWMRDRRWSRICTAAARPAPARVRLDARLDKAGQGVLAGVSS